MTSATDDVSDRERGLRPAIRDIVAGTALIGIGLWTGGSTLDGDFDRLDVFFDVLGGLWIVWGLVRLILALRSSAADSR